MSQDMNEHTSANTVTASTSENLPTTEVNEQTTTNNGSMSIIAHLTELRKRLIRSLIAIGIGSCVAYYFIEDIMHILTGPAGKLYYMQPAEAFLLILKLLYLSDFYLLSYSFISNMAICFTCLNRYGKIFNLRYRAYFTNFIFSWFSLFLFLCHASWDKILNGL